MFWLQSLVTLNGRLSALSSSLQRCLVGLARSPWSGRTGRSDHSRWGLKTGHNKLLLLKTFVKVWTKRFCWQFSLPNTKTELESEAPGKNIFGEGRAALKDQEDFTKASVVVRMLRDTSWPPMTNKVWIINDYWTLTYSFVISYKLNIHMLYVIIVIVYLYWDWPGLRHHWDSWHRREHISPSVSLAGK